MQYLLITAFSACASPYEYCLVYTIVHILYENSSLLLSCCMISNTFPELRLLNSNIKKRQNEFFTPHISL
jgi:hypothetical protein